MAENIFEAPREAEFPPLFQGQALGGSADPFAKACALATIGCDAGVLVHNISPDMVRAAIVFAPETALEQAMWVMCTCGVGFQNALGALAPPEVSVHLTWAGDIQVNGGTCGRLRAAASTNDPKQEPDWLVVGLELDLIPKSNDAPGNTPDQTSLYQEGCGDVTPIHLLESWARHTLVWINRQASDGVEPVHAEWLRLVVGIGDEITVSYENKEISGKFLGVDEDFGMLIRDGKKSQLIPLSSRLEGVGYK